METTLKPLKLLKVLLFIIFVLLLMNFIDIVSTYYFNNDHFLGHKKLIINFDFNFNNEYNIPTYYSVFTMLVSSMLLGIIALLKKNKRNEYYYWLGLSILFLFLSMDELFSIHEALIKPTREYLTTSGLFYFAWVIPYGIALILFALLYIRFILHLPKRTRYLFILSGVIFISGAVGVEMFEGKAVELYGRDNIIFALYYTFEEMLEMLGMAVFIYALISYIGDTIKSFTIIFKLK